MPDDIDLPNKSTLIDRELANAKQFSVTHTAEQKETLRLREAARRRASKRNQT
jgi:hypothetical protein